MVDFGRPSPRTEVPVALFLFNRPSHTARVFSAIEIARPSRLFLIADGPRRDHLTDATRCTEARGIVENINWPCTVERCYSDENLGCRRRISSGLNWVFDQVEEAIILEDDTLPNPTFFRFCAELLDRYSDTREVMSIGGSLLIENIVRPPESYWFSRYPHIWGWATWRHAWARYDLAMQEWPSLRNTGWPASVLERQWMAEYYSSAFDAAYTGFDTWDYSWSFASLRCGGLTALPSENLVMNIGFDAEGTHTTSSQSNFANRPTRAMAFPLRHPNRIEPWRNGDVAIAEALRGQAIASPPTNDLI